MGSMKSMRHVSNFIIVCVTVVIGLMLGEIFFRHIDGYQLDRLRLIIRKNHNIGTPQAILRYAKEETFNKSFDISWFSTSTSDLVDYDRSPKFPLPSEWISAVKNYKRSPGEPPFVKNEFKFLYNKNWLLEACKTGNHTNVIKFYKNYPGFVFSFEGPDNSVNPPYRLVPSGWTRGEDYYNNFGFRGPDISPYKGPRVIRLAFLGASTTANGWPFTYPEYVVHFLKKWAKAKKLDVDFDLINAGRGGTNSPIIDKIMRYEVAPLHPDIVLYYEGANDLHADSVLPKTQDRGNSVIKKTVLRPFMHLTYLPLEKYSALLDRIYEFLFRRGGPADEPIKPPHKLTFDLSQRDPDIEQKGLPFSLNEQIKNIRDMAASSRSVGAKFFIGSFVTLVHDGLRLDPEQHRIILAGLNGEYAPLTYKEIRNAVDFQNSVYRKLAKTDGFTFLDIDKYFPQDPDLFADMVHFSDQSGFRLQGWVVAQLLAPYISSAIKNGILPKPAYNPDPKEIAWAKQMPIKFDLSCLK